MKKKYEFYHFPLALIAVLHMAPIVTIILNSLRSNREIELELIGVPTKLLLQNYVNTWILGEYLIAYRNNVIIGIFTVLIVLVVNGLAAYGITKHDIYFKRFFLAYFFAVLSIPGFGIIVSLYFIFQRLGLVNSHPGIILIYSALEIPFSLLFMRAFFVGIPNQLEEAARIDGCGYFRIYTAIILPVIKPVLVTLAIFVFKLAWNDFLWPLIIIRKMKNQLLMVVIQTLPPIESAMRDIPWGATMAAASLSVFPLLILFIILRRQFISGATQGAIK